MSTATYLIVVETTFASNPDGVASGGVASGGVGSDDVDPEAWYAQHADEVRRIEGVVRVERYWSDDENRSRHLALYHVADTPEVMSHRFDEAKTQGRLSTSPFPNRTMRSYRLHSSLAN